MVSNDSCSSSPTIVAQSEANLPQSIKEDVRRGPCSVTSLGHEKSPGGTILSEDAMLASPLSFQLSLEASYDEPDGQVGEHTSLLMKTVSGLLERTSSSPGEIQLSHVRKECCIGHFLDDLELSSPCRSIPFVSVNCDGSLCQERDRKNSAAKSSPVNHLPFSQHLLKASELRSKSFPTRVHVEHAIREDDVILSMCPDHLVMTPIEACIRQQSQEGSGRIGLNRFQLSRSYARLQRAGASSSRSFKSTLSRSRSSLSGEALISREESSLFNTNNPPAPNEEGGDTSPCRSGSTSNSATNVNKRAEAIQRAEEEEKARVEIARKEVAARIPKASILKLPSASFRVILDVPPDFQEPHDPVPTPRLTWRQPELKGCYMYPKDNEKDKPKSRLILPFINMMKLVAGFPSLTT